MPDYYNIRKTKTKNTTKLMVCNPITKHPQTIPGLVR